MTQSNNSSMTIGEAYYKPDGELDYINLRTMNATSSSLHAAFELDQQGRAQRRNWTSGATKNYPVNRGEDFLELVIERFKTTLDVKGGQLRSSYALDSIVRDHLLLCIAQVLLEDDESHAFQVRRKIDIADI